MTSSVSAEDALGRIQRRRHRRMTSPPRSKIHATSANGEGGGGKNACNKDLQMKGLRLSLRWLKPPVPSSSDVPVVPAILRENGKVTSPSLGPGVGRGSPRHVDGEREPLWPSTTAVRQQLVISYTWCTAHSIPLLREKKNFPFSPPQALETGSFNTASDTHRDARNSSYF
jgi:hypothetical protein